MSGYQSLFNESTVSADIIQFSTGAVPGYFLICEDVNGSFKWQDIGSIAVVDILGVTNQTVVTDDGKGIYTIGTSQDISTISHPQFEYLKLTTGAGAGKILTSDASGNTSWISPSYVSSIVGTANQIIVTDDGKGNYTISTPQDINTTSSPTFSTVTANLSGNLTATNTISRNIIPDGNNTRTLGDPLTYYNLAYISQVEGNAYSATYVLGPSQFLITTLASLATAGKFTNVDTNPTIGANLLSLTNNTYDIGTSSNKFANVFRNIYATTFNGALNGNASTATTAGSATTAATVTGSTQTAITTLPNVVSINGQSISGTDLAKIVGITNGTAASDKALVLDSSSNITGISQIGTDYILIGSAGTSITPNIVFAAAAADSGIYGTSSNQIGISISKASKLLAKSTGVDINGTLALNGSQTISSDLTVSGTLTTGTLSLTTLNATTGNITTVNSTTLNNTGTATCNRYLCQNTSGTLAVVDARHQFIQSVNANDNNVNNYLPYFEVSPVTTILGNTQNVIGLYNQSRFNPASGVTLARGYGNFTGLIHNGVGTTTDLSSIYIANMYKASGNVTNNVALRIEEQTMGTNNFAMYSGGLHQFYRLNSIADTVIINNTNATTGSATRLLNMYGNSASQGVYYDLGRTNSSSLRMAIASSNNQFAPGSVAGNACITNPGDGRILLGSDGSEVAPLILGKSSATYPVAMFNGITLNITNFGYLSSTGAGNIVGTQSWPICLYVDKSIVCNQQIMVTSDFRVKSQIRDITNEEIDKFLTISAKNFVKGETVDPVYGFISQDFCKAGLLDCTDTVPKEGVEEHYDEASNFRSPAGALITLHNEGITALLHATIKRQQEQINNLINILARNNIE